MEQIQFTTHAQYDDFKGLVSIDGADVGNKDIHDILRELKIDMKKYCLVGIEIYKEHYDFVSLYVLDMAGIDTAREYIQSIKDDEPIKVFRVNTKLTLEQFIKRTKRFSMILEPRGLNIINREMIVEDIN
ncbi:MAG: hypothetical protein LBF71_05410 [Campylobacteraceae bacterium]|jgi:hypothetical protein|nr:hypothetical protein [Campylobacteraceae bacterium]